MIDAKTPMVSYKMAGGDTRFLQYAKDKLPSWATDVQPHIEPEQARGAEQAQDRNRGGWYTDAVADGGMDPRSAAPVQPAGKVPLTVKHISELWDGHTVPVFGKIGINPIVFARAIEAAHGIKE